MSTLALDIGATKIAVALLDHEHSVQERLEIPSNVTTNIWEELELLLRGFKPERVGIASAGPINVREGSISPVNIPQWRQFPIRRKLQDLFPSTPIGLLGDGTAVALAENKLGAGRGSRNMLAVVVSTGIGGGLVIDGKAFHGETGNAGLFGHHAIAFDSEILCDCGRIGCLETFARGPKMVEIAGKAGWTGGNDFKALAQSAREGDLVALDAIDKGTLALAVGITNVLNILDLHTVVIGGGVSFAGEIYWEPFLRHFHRERLHAGFLDEIDIYPAKLQADAGLIGASLFAQDIDE
jgi:glucokinase